MTTKGFSVEVPQNVEISKKIPCEKPLTEQLHIRQVGLLPYQQDR